MNELHNIIANLRQTMVYMAYGLIKDYNEIQEIVQETLVYMLQMNQTTLKKIYDKDGKDGLLRYAGVVMRRSVHSTKSPYYYKYKKYYENISWNYSATAGVKPYKNIPNEAPDIKWQYLEKIDEILDTKYWYDKEIFKLYYYENNTLDSLAEKTGISRNSIYNTINKIRQEIKEELDDQE